MKLYEMVRKIYCGAKGTLHDVTLEVRGDESGYMIGSLADFNCPEIDCFDFLWKHRNDEVVMFQAPKKNYFIFWIG